MQPYIFLDAGWTLVFPDYGLLRRVTSQRGYDIAQARWERVMAEFTWYYDDARKHGIRISYGPAGQVSRTAIGRGGIRLGTG